MEIEASISGRLRSRSDFPWTMAALLMRTVGGPSCSIVSLDSHSMLPVAVYPRCWRGERVRRTYIRLNLLRDLCESLFIRHITPVKAHPPRLPRLQLPNINHRNRRPPHSIHLGNQQPQPARAASNHNHLLIKVHLPRQPIRHALVNRVDEPTQRDESGPGAGDEDLGVVPGVGLRAEAEGDDEGDEGVEEGHF